MSAIEVYKMSNEEKVEQAIRRSLPLMPADARREVEALLTKESIAVMVGVLTLWALSHFIGVGEIADVVLLVAGVAALGGVAVQVAQDLYKFGDYALNAKSEQELDLAAKYFAHAVVVGGITTIMALLLRRSAKSNTLKHNKADLIKLSEKLETAPTTDGKLFYKPKVVTGKVPSGLTGYTTEYGDIYISSRLSTTERQLTLIHEKVHSILTPKLQIFRDIRVRLRVNSYTQSFILQYLEEALAETIAQAGVKGMRGVITRIKYPINGGYMTVAEIGTELKGILIGPINVGGATYMVAYELTSNDQ